jgi:hypothetical protein
MDYIGLDVHKKTISYCVKDASGQVHQEGKVGATRRDCCVMKHLKGWSFRDLERELRGNLRGRGNHNRTRLDRVRLVKQERV